MSMIEVLSDICLEPLTDLSIKFINASVKTLKDAAVYIKNVNYGYNSVSDDLFIVLRKIKVHVRQNMHYLPLLPLSTMCRFIKQ